jgi:cysteine desulfurase
LESSHWLKSQGFEVDYLSVDKYGSIDLEELKKLIKENTLLVSVIHGNNEIGVIQDIEAIGKICREKNVYFHTDASQSYSKINIDVDKMSIDLLTASSHKVYGPKGVGILYVRKGVLIEPLLHGGGHENKLRSSTVNVPAIVGFAKATEILAKEGKQETERLRRLRDYMIEKLQKNIKNIKLNGHPTKRLSNNINMSFFGAEGESLVLELDSCGVMVSTGSACSSKTLVPSHVLLAIGLQPQEAHGSLRISLGRFTKKTDVDYAVEKIIDTVKKIRKISLFSYE